MAFGDGTFQITSLCKKKSNYGHSHINVVIEEEHGKIQDGEVKFQQGNMQYRVCIVNHII